jgi:hypothetical protein
VSNLGWLCFPPTLWLVIGQLVPSADWLENAQFMRNPKSQTPFIKKV